RHLAEGRVGPDFIDTPRRALQCCAVLSSKGFLDMKAIVLCAALCLLGAPACKKKDEPGGKGGTGAGGATVDVPQIPPPPAAPPMMALPTVDGGAPRDV